MNFKSLSPFASFKQRRDFLKIAGSAAAAGALPTLDALTNVAHAAGGIDPAQVAADYKAIVCVFFYGGQDHSNLLIPYQDGNAAGTLPATTTVEFDRYALARSNFSTANPGGDTPNQANGNLAFTRAQLAATALPATTGNSLNGGASAPTAAGWTTNTHGRQFALHPNYAELKALYDSQQLAVIANVGPLIAPINRAQWYGPSASRPATPANLYSHDDQQKSWMSGTANITNPSVGIGGRIANDAAITALNAGALVATQISIDGSNTFMLTDLNPSPSAIAYQLGTGSIGRLQTATTTPVWTTVGTTTCNSDSSFINDARNASSPYCVRGGPIAISNGSGNVSSGNPTLKSAFLSRMNATSEGSSIYSDQWRQTMKQSVDTEAVISAAFINSPPTEEIVAPFIPIIGGGSTGLPYNNLAAQLRMVAAMIRASSQLDASSGPLKRQIFFVGIGGFDTHGSEFWRNNVSLNGQISKAINAFWTAMGNIKVIGAPAASAQGNVTLFTMSEFGRTLDSNGEGSDHGWGTHQIVLGGAVKGGKIYGQDHNITAAQAGTSPFLGTNATVRADLTAGAVPRVGLPPNRYSAPNTAGLRCNGLNHMLDRGELLPTTSSDAVVATVARWFGVPPASLGSVFPTLATAHPVGSDIGFMS